MSTISAVSQNAAQYNASVLNVIKTADTTDFSNPTPLAQTSTERTMSDVKLQTSVAAFNAEKKTEALVVDLFA
ncbi:MAG: hypothetical protein WCD42_05705 [Rhizomicrobium sp.]